MEHIFFFLTLDERMRMAMVCKKFFYAAVGDSDLVDFNEVKRAKQLCALINSANSHVIGAMIQNARTIIIPEIQLLINALRGIKKACVRTQKLIVQESSGYSPYDTMPDSLLNAMKAISFDKDSPVIHFFKRMHETFPNIREFALKLRLNEYYVEGLVKGFPCLQKLTLLQPYGLWEPPFGVTTLMNVREVTGIILPCISIRAGNGKMIDPNELMLNSKARGFTVSIDWTNNGVSNEKISFIETWIDRISEMIITIHEPSKFYQNDTNIERLQALMKVHGRRIRVKLSVSLDATIPDYMHEWNVVWFYLECKGGYEIPLKNTIIFPNLEELCIFTAFAVNDIIFVTNVLKMCPKLKNLKIKSALLKFRETSLADQMKGISQSLIFYRT